MGKKELVGNRQYTDEFKVEAVRLGESMGGNPERVRNSLKRQDLRAVYKRAYRVTTGSVHHQPVAPNVLDRRFDGWGVNQAWVADISVPQQAA